MNARPAPKIPAWFIALAVLVSGAITAWAVLRKQGGNQWPGDPSTMPQRVTQALTPVMAAPDPFQKVAATRGPSVVRAGTPAPHPDRGACTLCHIIVDKLGAAIPSIRAMSSLPHPYRGGICTNCHAVNNSTSSTATTVGAIQPAAGAVTPPPLGMVRAAPPREGAWLGLEVVPITAITAAQYKLPAGLSGLVVAEAEGAAAGAGLRAGDVLVAVNGVAVPDPQTFRQAIGAQQGGTVDVLRGGKVLRATLSPAAAPAAASPAAPAAAAAWPGAAPQPPQVVPY